MEEHEDETVAAKIGDEFDDHLFTHSSDSEESCEN